MVDTVNRRIDEELVSVDALKHVLCVRCGSMEVSVRREENDPPDFTVTVDGEHFPVEVTSIVSGEQHRARYKELARAISDRAQSRGGVSGSYALFVWRFPQVPKPTSNKAHRILDAAVDYLAVTRQQPTAAEEHLLRDESGRITIQKVSVNGSTVGNVWIPPAMWAVQIHRELATLIQQAVDDKKRKLQDKGINSKRALLLLYDAFGYAPPKHAVTALQQVRAYDEFHSIFWAASFSDRKNITSPDQPGRDGVFLFSSNPEWMRLGGLQSDEGA